MQTWTQPNQQQTLDVTQAYLGDPPEDLPEVLDRWPFSCGLAGWNALPKIQQLLAAFRERELPVFFTDMPDGGATDLWHGEGIEPGADFAPQEIMSEIAPLPGETVLTKTTPSAFFGTPLMPYFTSLGVDSVVLCGTSTSGCVRSSAVEAYANNLGVVVVDDASFDRFEASHAMALFDVHFKYGSVQSAEEVVKAVGNYARGLFAGRTVNRGLNATTSRDK